MDIWGSSSIETTGQRSHGQYAVGGTTINRRYDTSFAGGKIGEFAQNITAVPNY